MTLRYTPGGDWLCVARGSVVVMVPGTMDPKLLEGLWEALADGPDLQSILPAVTGGFGAGLASMPPFGVVSFADRLHVLLRGPVRLSVVSGGDAVELSGDRVTTWTERIFDGGTDAFTLAVGSPTAAGEGSLVLEAGVVQAHSVSLAPARVSEASRAELPAAPATPGDPEAAFTGALEAEESATINPGLFHSDADGNAAVQPSEVAKQEGSTDSARDEESSEPAGFAPDEARHTNDDGADSDDSDDNDSDDDAANGDTIGPHAIGGGTGERTGDDTGDSPQESAEGSTNDSPEDSTVAPPAEPLLDDDDPELSTTGYDHLWDRTVVRRVEDAAVRSTDESESDDNEPAPAAGPASAEVSDHSASEEPAPPASTPEEAPRREVPPSSSGLIDSVPWARSRPEPQAATPVPKPRIAPAARPAVVPPPVVGLHPGPASADPQSGADEDHDGQTIMRSDLQSADSDNPGSNNAGSVQVPDVDARPSTGPLVLARLCAQGHANPPEAPGCALCSQPLESDSREVRRPSLGTMRISSGEVVELDQSLIIGRQPSVSRVQGRGMPKLVQVTSEGGDISRSHVEVRLDGWHVLLCDLRATNGTVLIRAGHPPRRLGEGESAFLLDGDVAQLGDDVFLRFEGLR